MDVPIERLLADFRWQGTGFVDALTSPFKTGKFFVLVSFRRVGG